MKAKTLNISMLLSTVASLLSLFSYLNSPITVISPQVCHTQSPWQYKHSTVKSAKQGSWFPISSGHMLLFNISLSEHLRERHLLLCLELRLDYCAHTVIVSLTLPSEILPLGTIESVAGKCYWHKSIMLIRLHTSWWS